MYYLLSMMMNPLLLLAALLSATKSSSLWAVIAALYCYCHCSDALSITNVMSSSYTRRVALLSVQDE